jgi:hypothetical protein
MGTEFLMEVDGDLDSAIDFVFALFVFSAGVWHGRWRGLRAQQAAPLRLTWRVERLRGVAIIH